MKVLRLLVICCWVLLLLPSPAQAASHQEDLGCSLANLPFFGWLSGFKVSKRAVMIDGIEVDLSICAQSSESYTAEQMLELLARALPSLSAHAGVPLYGSTDRSIVMVDKDKLLPFADGQLNEKENVIEFHRRSQDWTVVHEGAHYWANHENFQEEWMVEGYAEYMTEQAMISMGSKLRLAPVEPICDDTPLRTWINTGINICGYTAGAVIFHDLSQAVGEKVFMETLRLLAMNGGVESDKLLIELERASGKDLLDTMRRVYPPEEFQARKMTRDLFRALDDAKGRAYPLGITLPPEIAQAIGQRNFAYAQDWLAALNALFPAAEALVKRCHELDLQCTPIWSALPAAPDGMPVLQTQLDAASRLLNQYSPLRQQARAISLDPPAPLTQAVQAFDQTAAEHIRQANASLTSGLALEDRCRQLRAPCADSWRTLWKVGAFKAAGVVVTDTAALLTLAEGVEKSCGGFVETCNGIWHPALKQAQLIEAKQALETLGQALDSLDKVQQSCGNVGDVCRKTWAEALQSGGFAGANRTLSAIDTMLTSGKALQNRCTNDWPCQQSWQNVYRRTGDTQAAIKRMDEITDRLPQLQAAVRIISTSGGPDAARDENAPIIQAQHALIAGQLDQASALAEEIIAAQQRREWINKATPIAGAIVLVVALALAILTLIFTRNGQRRLSKHAPQLPAQARDSDLLATLLAQPPRTGRPDR